MFISLISVGGMVQVLCVQLPLAYGGVGLWSQLRGLPLGALSPEEISLAALGSDLIQLAGVIAIINYGLLVAGLHQGQVRNVLHASCGVPTRMEIPFCSCLPCLRIVLMIPVHECRNSIPAKAISFPTRVMA